jgi:hypothetical protein
LPEYEVTEVEEVCCQPTRWAHPYWYLVKRQLAETKAGELYWKYNATVPNGKGLSARKLIGWHLQRAAMENATKEHKSGCGLEKLPTQKFHANWAFLFIGRLAFNLMAWFKRLVLPSSYQPATIKTIQHHLLKLVACSSIAHMVSSWLSPTSIATKQSGSFYETIGSLAVLLMLTRGFRYYLDFAIKIEKPLEMWPVLSKPRCN